MADVTIHADAEAEYEAALAWYLARSAPAAAGFEAAFEQALASIAANPQLFPLCDDRHRFAAESNGSGPHAPRLANWMPPAFFEYWSRRQDTP